MLIRTLYMLPMLLGRTFDARHDTVGIDIFPDEEILKAKVLAETFYRSNYQMIETSSEVKDFLSISGALSLKIKAGAFAVKGSGSYLKESLSATNVVDVLTKVNYRTYSKTLRNSAKPLNNWLMHRDEDLGTHYVQSITYGGDLIACLRFKAKKEKDLQDIRGTVKASLESGSALELVAEGKLEMLEEKLENKAQMEIIYFATVPLEGIAHNITGLRELVRNFDNHVKKVNNGWGVPIEVELNELSSLNNRFSFLKNLALETELQFFEESFNDLLSTKSGLLKWLKTVPSTLTKEQEAQLADLKSRLDKTLRAYFDVIGNLDLESGPEQLISAQDSYQKNGKSGLAGKFRREFEKLKRKMVVQIEKSPNEGSSVYTQWGKTQCNKANQTTTLYTGYMASSGGDYKGTGSNYVCLPASPKMDTTVTMATDKGSDIRGIKYGLLVITPFKVDNPQMIFRGVVCSVCHIDQRPSALTFSGLKECPVEWTNQYSGYLMSSKNVNRGEYVCVDEQPEHHDASDPEATDQSLHLVMMSSEFPNSEKSKQKGKHLHFVPCVVCSK